METNLLEVALAPECVHTDKREKKYYLMKRFVKTAIKHQENGHELRVKIVSFFYETPYNFWVMVNGDARFDDVTDIFCTPDFSNDERREILASLNIVAKEKMECEAEARGYCINSNPVMAVITF